MKRLIPTAALLCLPLFVGCEAETDVTPVAPPADGATAVESGSGSAAVQSDMAAKLAAYEGPVTFSVPDMHCEFTCAPEVQNTLAEMNGVSDVEADAEARTVKFKVTKDFDAKAAMQALAEKNFPVDNVMI